MRARVALIAALLLVPSIAFGACGSGYRGPDGRCVPPAALARVCGNPPAQKCSADAAQPRAAVPGSDMKHFMEGARERAMGY